nr:MAG TPA: REGULATORY PROTEIN E2/DNA Complex-18, E2, DNA-binding domain, E2-DNA.4A [Crassvirales sp.]
METKEVKITIPEGYEIDEQNSTFECIKFKKIHQINTWEDIPRVNGCYMNNSHIYTGYEGKPCEENKDVYLTDKYAKSALALAQISQLMPYYGCEITNEEWKRNDRKFTIVLYDGELKPFTHVNNKVLVAFHTEAQRTRFMSFPENIQLVKDLYMMD